MTNEPPIIESSSPPQNAKPRMSILGKLIFAYVIINFITTTIFFSHRTNMTQLLSFPFCMAFPVVFILSIAYIFIEWRRRRWSALLPLAALILSMIISAKVTGRIREYIFDKSLPSYKAVVKKMEDGTIPVSTNSYRIPQAESQACLAHAVFAWKDTNGVLVVEFWTEGGFPVKHSGYLYISSGIIDSNLAARWPINRPEKETNWFYISD